MAYKITWKLACMERTFAPSDRGRFLSFNRVVQELLFRFDKEIRRGRRPPIRQILNRDVSACSMMILCVALIYRKPPQLDSEKRDVKSHEKIMLELTDGWYSVHSAPDVRLCEFIARERIRVGTKLFVSNATLMGFDEGIDPLDRSYDPFTSGTGPVLHISANATRLARWDAKLGFVRPNKDIASQEGMLLVRKISDILEDGGRIPLIELRVKHCFPLQYLERNNESGVKGNILTAEEESTRIEKLEKRRQYLIDHFADEVQVKCVQDVDQQAPDLWHRIVHECASSDFVNEFDPESKELIDRWNEQRLCLLHKRIQQEIEEKLEESGFAIEPSIPFLKILVTSHSVHGSIVDLCEEATVTVWNPTAEQLELLRAGNVVRMKNLEVRPGKWQGVLQLSASGHTSMSAVTHYHGLPVQVPATTLWSVFRIHKASMELAERYKSDKVPENIVIDVVGIVVQVKQVDTRKNVLLVDLTDESNLVLRIFCREDHTNLTSFLMDSTCEECAGPVIRFSRLHVMPYDVSERCAVAEFNVKSDFTSPPTCLRSMRLYRWSISRKGSSKLAELRVYREIGLKDTLLPERRIHKALGYVAGFSLKTEHSQLFLHVDCGGNSMQTWSFPLSHVTAFSHSVSSNQMEEKVVLQSDEETQLRQLRTIGRVLRSRQTMYCFTLSSGSSIEISNVSGINTVALAALYLTLQI